MSSRHGRIDGSIAAARTHRRLRGSSVDLCSHRAEASRRWCRHRPSVAEPAMIGVEVPSCGISVSHGSHDGHACRPAAAAIAAACNGHGRRRDPVRQPINHRLKSTTHLHRSTPAIEESESRCETNDRCQYVNRRAAPRSLSPWHCGGTPLPVPAGSLDAEPMSSGIDVASAYARFPDSISAAFLKVI